MDENLKLVQFLNEVNHGIIAVDSETKIIYANICAEKILGVEGETLGERFRGISTGQCNFINKCIQTGKSQVGNFINEKKIVFYNSIPIQQDRSLIGALCYLHEIHQTEMPDYIYGFPNDIIKLFGYIFKYSIDGIVLLDKNGRAIAINEALCSLVGVRKEEILGKVTSNGVRDGLWDYSTASDVFKMKRQVSHVEYLPKTQKDIVVTGIPIFDDDGEISTVIMNERDITQLNELRRELEKNRLLKEKYENQIAGMNILEFKEKRIIAQSKELRDVFKAALRCAQMEVSNILISGESGTGKGLLAKFICNNSKRKDKPYVQINCAALPDTLLEAELFGYEEGAFTGTMRGGKAGLFELADNGVLFLDEIAELPVSVQAKLLKYLDDQEIMHLGGIKPLKINCIVIAATNQNLNNLVKTGKFRNDLFHRLNAFSIKIPPLQGREDDIISLANYFIQKYNQLYKVKKRCSPGMLRRLCTYSFPGNVRQLKNIIHNAVVMSDRRSLDDFLQVNLEDSEGGNQINLNKPFGLNNRLKDQILSFEKSILKKAVKKCKTTREMAAYVGASHTTLVRKLKKHGLSKIEP
jgi:PAS domain S-box-containing protein/TyrR family helix-turn-helix protein